MPRPKSECTECGKTTTRYHPILDIPLCSPCQRTNDTKYKYISKTKALSAYGLKPKDLDQLGVYEVKNPHYSSASPMQLYMLSHVKKLARSQRNVATTPTEFPQEVAAVFLEGHAVQVTVKRYERSAEARKKCIDHFGHACAVCGIELRDVYGDVAENFIHVHHLNPISITNPGSVVDPIEDLRPVCPNCHSIIHLGKPPYSIEEVKRMVDSKR